MGHTYAGILGPLAFATTAIRGVAGGNGPETTLLAASASLWCFAALGFVAGRLAEFIVEESVWAGISGNLTPSDDGEAGAQRSAQDA